MVEKYLAKYIDALKKCKTELETPEDVERLKEKIKGLFERATYPAYSALSGTLFMEARNNNERETLQEKADMLQGCEEWAKELIATLDENVRGDNFQDVVDASETLVFLLEDYMDKFCMKKLEKNPDFIWEIPGTHVSKEFIQVAMDGGVITTANLQLLQDKIKKDRNGNSSRTLEEDLDAINAESIDIVKIKSIFIPEELLVKAQEIIKEAMNNGTIKKTNIEDLDMDILIDDSERNLERMIEKFKSEDFSLKDIVLPDTISKGDER